MQEISIGVVLDTIRIIFDDAMAITIMREYDAAFKALTGIVGVYDWSYRIKESIDI